MQRARQEHGLDFYQVLTSRHLGEPPPPSGGILIDVGNRSSVPRSLPQRNLNDVSSVETRTCMVGGPIVTSPPVIIMITSQPTGLQDCARVSRLVVAKGSRNRLWEVCSRHSPHKTHFVVVRKSRRKEFGLFDSGERNLGCRASGH